MKIDISSFQIEQEIKIHAPLERVFHSLVNDINDWWEFRIDESNSSMTIDPQVGGHLWKIGIMDKGRYGARFFITKKTQKFDRKDYLG